MNEYDHDGTQVSISPQVGFCARNAGGYKQEHGHITQRGAYTSLAFGPGGTLSDMVQYNTIPRPPILAEEPLWPGLG